MTNKQRIAKLERDLERLEEALLVVRGGGLHPYAKRETTYISAYTVPTEGPLAGVYRRVRNRAGA